MSEFATRLGQRQQLREQRLGLTAEIEALRDRLRGQLDPLTEPGDMDGEGIAVTAGSLAGRLIELRHLDRKLGILARELGE